MTHAAPMFDVVFLRLDDPDKIRQWRTEDLARMLGVGLDEAFSMGLGQPSVLRRGVSQDEASRLERAVEDVGGAVKVRPAASPETPPTLCRCP